LIQRADQLMYEAKGERACHIYLQRVRLENGELHEMTTDNPVVVKPRLAATDPH
jgi:hypothetical protein